jgi:hypothetical protein
MRRDDENPAADDSLDRVIRDALWVELDGREVATLEKYWRLQLRRDKWRQHGVALFTAAAAMIAVVAGLVLVRSRERDREVAVVAKASPGELAEANPTLLPQTADNSQGAKPSPSTGRAATAYEQLVFASRSRSDVYPAATTATIDAAIQRVAANPNGNPAEIIASFNLKPPNAEMLLLKKLSNAIGKDKHAIVRMLAVCGSRRSVPALLRLAESEVVPTSALASIEQIVGINGLAQIVARSKDPGVRADLMIRLLRCGSQDGLIGLLSLVSNDSVRAEALSVAKGAPNVPIAELITLLDHADEQVRIAAAMTLGYVNGPKTTELLISRVTEQPANSPEAWIALMSCRGEMARDFLAYATRRPQLLGYYNNARVHWAQMIP